MVSTYLLGGHYPHGSGLGSQDAFTGRLLWMVRGKLMTVGA